MTSRSRTATFVLTLGICLAFPTPPSAVAQTGSNGSFGPAALATFDRRVAELAQDQFRVGVTLGGTSFVALALEYQFEGRGVELSAGTFSWRDFSVSVVGKQYLGGGSVRGFLGAGFWAVVAFPPEGRRGHAFVLRAPGGLDWELVERHSAGFEINLNRALSIRRTDPDDERPARTRIVPLPALYYRFGRPR